MSEDIAKRISSNVARFSIVITSHNQKEFINDAVDSALNQWHAAKEIIVVDDGSTDGSVETLKNYRDVRLIQLQANEGACAARNCGAGAADGEYLVFLDGDDLLLPWALNVYNRIVCARSPKLLISSMMWFKKVFPGSVADSSGGIKIIDYEYFIKKDRPIRVSASATIVEGKSFREAGGWTVGLFPMDDYDLLLKLGLAGRTIQIVSPHTVAYRVHSNNMIHQVQRIARSVPLLIERERSGCYPGGRSAGRARRAVIGGVVFYWLKRSLRERLYRESGTLMADGWRMIAGAMYERIAAIMHGRQREETLQMFDFSKVDTALLQQNLTT